MVQIEIFDIWVSHHFMFLFQKTQSYKTASAQIIYLHFFLVGAIKLDVRTIRGGEDFEAITRGKKCFPFRGQQYLIRTNAHIRVSHCYTISLYMLIVQTCIFDYVLGTRIESAVNQIKFNETVGLL